MRYRTVDFSKELAGAEWPPRGDQQGAQKLRTLVSPFWSFCAPEKWAGDEHRIERRPRGAAHVARGPAAG